MKKKKLLVFLGILTLLLLAMFFLAHKAYEARKAEVVANCRVLLGKETLEEKEKNFLAKYPGAKIYRPWEGASDIAIPPSGIISEGIGQIAFGFHYWNEVKIHDDPSVKGWTYASSGYDFCIFDAKNKSGCVIQIEYIFYAETSDNCSAKIISIHKP